MFSEYSDLIKKIINLILDAIPFECSEIHYLGEVEQNKKSYGSTFYYKKNNDSECHYVYDLSKEHIVKEEKLDELFGRLNLVLINLYDSFIEHGLSTWDSIEIHFTDDSADAQLHYDWYSKNMDPYTRRIVWAYMSFGLKPKPGSYQENLLDKYLQSNDIS